MASGIKVKINNNSAKVKAQLDGNVKAALTAMGIKAVNLIQRQMESGYGRRIWDSGDLMGSIDSDPERSAPKTVDVGTGVDYAHFVHDGTYFMPARPFIRDAIEKSGEELKETAQAVLKKGFDK